MIMIMIQPTDACIEREGKAAIATVFDANRVPVGTCYGEYSSVAKMFSEIDYAEYASSETFGTIRRIYATRMIETVNDYDPPIRSLWVPDPDCPYSVTETLPL